jgi:hypothetical protein
MISLFQMKCKKTIFERSSIMENFVELSMNEMELIDGGITARQVGNAAGRTVGMLVSSTLVAAAKFTEIVSGTLLGRML